MLSNVFLQIVSCHGKSAWGRNMVHQENFLGDTLIHSHGTAEITGSCVTDSQQVKGSLHLSILTICAVKSKEHNVTFFTKFQNIWSEKASAFFLHLLDLRIEAAHILCCFFHIIFSRERILPVYILNSTENIYKYCLMAFLAQRTADSGTGYNGNLSLRTGSSSQNYYLHNLISPFLFVNVTVQFLHSYTLCHAQKSCIRMISR